MKRLVLIVPRWLPALLMMAAIFVFSSQPGDNLPDFFSWDRVVKKGGHMMGYGLLALSYLHWLRYDKKYYPLAWLISILYAATDEFHQSFIAGRNASVFDVLFFDNLGAMIGLWLHFMVRRKNEKKIHAA
jgi:VanZ family protein